MKTGLLAGHILPEQAQASTTLELAEHVQQFLPVQGIARAPLNASGDHKLLCLRMRQQGAKREAKSPIGGLSMFSISKEKRTVVPSPTCERKENSPLQASTA